MSVYIYHNPRCSKSRACLEALPEFTKDFTVVKYLEQTFTEDGLKEVLQKLGMRPMELIRTSEELYKEKIKGQDLNDETLIRLMVENPRLIQRPIVVKGDKAVVARPTEEIAKLF